MLISATKIIKDYTANGHAFEPWTKRRTAIADIVQKEIHSNKSKDRKNILKILDNVYYSSIKEDEDLNNEILEASDSLGADLMIGLRGKDVIPFKSSIYDNNTKHIMYKALTNATEKYANDKYEYLDHWDTVTEDILSEVKSKIGDKYNQSLEDTIKSDLEKIHTSALREIANTKANEDNEKDFILAVSRDPMILFNEGFGFGGCYDKKYNYIGGKAYSDKFTNIDDYDQINKDFIKELMDYLINKGVCRSYQQIQDMETVDVRNLFTEYPYIKSNDPTGYKKSAFTMLKPDVGYEGNTIKTKNFYYEIPVFEEGVYRINTFRYIYWHIEHIDTENQIVKFFLEDYAYYDHIWQAVQGCEVEYKVVDGESVYKCNASSTYCEYFTMNGFEPKYPTPSILLTDQGKKDFEKKLKDKKDTIRV